MTRPHGQRGAGFPVERGRQRRAWVQVSWVAVPVVLACSLAVGCGSPRQHIPEGQVYIDLLARLNRAQFMPAGDVRTAFVPDQVTIRGERKRAVIVPQPSRFIFKITLSPQAVLTGAFGIPDGADDHLARETRFVIGISNGRVYDGLLGWKGDTPGWTPIRVDLSAYSGWKWSLFYQPAGITWDLIFTVYGTPGQAAWAQLATTGSR